MQTLKRLKLPLILFLTGAAVLVIEIAAARILSPYYGNTIYSFSSIISVVLAALSLGYYLGGRLADRYPATHVFYGLITGSGLLVLAMHIAQLTLLPSMGYNLPMSTGPLVMALILFFLPSFVLGTLSPFAIKLQAAQFPEIGLGSISGEIFFWSTLGSIFGSLLTGFVLIPLVGISYIALGVGIFLTALGLLPLAFEKLGRKFMAKAVLAAVCLSVAGGALLSTNSQANALYSRDGLYEKLQIVDGTYKDKPTRFFYQDRSLSGGVRLDSDEMPFDYTKYYALYQIFKPELQRALVIGGGAYTVPKTLLAELPEVRVDVAEIEPSLHDLAKEYFYLPDDPRLQNYVQDGRRFLRDTDQTYDLIFSDVYFSVHSIPAHFTTEEFFKMARSKLSKDGIFVANLIGNIPQSGPSLVLSEVKTFQAAFENSYFFATRPDLGDTQNILFVGVAGDKKFDPELAAKAQFQAETMQKLATQKIDTSKFDLGPHHKLTDDFAPVEYLTSLLPKPD